MSITVASVKWYIKKQVSAWLVYLPSVSVQIDRNKTDYVGKSVFACGLSVA